MGLIVLKNKSTREELFAMAQSGYGFKSIDFQTPTGGSQKKNDSNNSVKVRNIYNQMKPIEPSYLRN